MRMPLTAVFAHICIQMHSTTAKKQQHSILRNWPLSH